MIKKHFHIIIGISVLFAIGFLFLHSELDLFSPEHHEHITHDFCEIVDNAHTEKSSTSKLELSNLDIPAVNFSNLNNLNKDSNTNYFYNSIKSKFIIDFNILYSSFLI